MEKLTDGEELYEAVETDPTYLEVRKVVIILIFLICVILITLLTLLIKTPPGVGTCHPLMCSSPYPSPLILSSHPLLTPLLLSSPYPSLLILASSPLLLSSPYPSLFILSSSPLLLSSCLLISALSGVFECPAAGGPTELSALCAGEEAGRAAGALPTCPGASPGEPGRLSPARRHPGLEAVCSGRQGTARPPWWVCYT